MNAYLKVKANKRSAGVDQTCWKRTWIRSSIKTATAIVQRSQPTRLQSKPVSVAGNTTG